MSRPAHANKPSRQIRSVHTNVQPIGQPKRRLRWSNLPKPGSGEVPYAKSRLELAGFSDEPPKAGDYGPEVPTIASSRSYLDERLTASLQRSRASLRPPATSHGGRWRRAR